MGEPKYTMIYEIKAKHEKRKKSRYKAVRLESSNVAK